MAPTDAKESPGLSVALVGALGALTRYGVDLTGFLGGYTTFSTFAYETHDLLQSRHLPLALLNAAVSVGAGIAGIYLGLFLIRR